MQQIVLSRVEWLKLCKLSSKVSDYMERTTEESQREEEQSWTLTPERRIGTVSGQPWKKVVTKTYSDLLQAAAILQHKSVCR